MNVKLDQAGRVEIPASVRSQLGVQPGDELSFEQHGGQWVVRPAMPSTVTPATESDDDDLNWPDMDYQSPRPKRIGKVAVKYTHRGRMKPIPIDFDEEP